MAREGHYRLWALLILPVVEGCHSRPPVTYPEYAPAPVAYAPASGSGNGFDAYAMAALDAERDGGRYLTLVSFYPKQKENAMALVQPDIAQIARATELPFKFQFAARAPFTPAPYQKGWRLIGRSLVWQIQDACKSGDFDKAVATTVLTTRFGFNLTGGSAVDASMGFVIADQARQSLAPNLGKLSPVQLQKLSSGLVDALAKKPPILNAIENETANMKVAVQALQDAYRNDGLQIYTKNLGLDVREPIGYLKDLQPEDPKRQKFFDSLAEYVTAMSDYAKKLATVPASARASMMPPKMPPDHPWRRLAKYIVRTPLPLPDMDDATVARTRLMIIESELIRRRQLHMELPADLKGFSAPINVDPYTGRPFIYHAEGSDYTVYSVGVDGIDNAGQTDATFTTPDLKLER